MSVRLACSRCDRVLELEARDEAGDPLEAEAIDVKDGMIVAVCSDCMTDSELIKAARVSSVALLDAAEEALESFKMVAERVPGMADDPDFKAARAEAEAKAEEARAALRALDEVDRPE